MSQNNTQRTFTDEEIAAIFDDLREALSCLPKNANVNDRVRLSIGICIENGIDTKPWIIGSVRKLGFEARHIAGNIDDCTGIYPGRHLWSLGSDGRYSNLDISSTLPDMG